MKSFSLNGKEVSVGDITLGDLKRVQKLLKGKDESDYPTVMIGYFCGVSEEEFDALPVSSLKEVEEISNYIAGKIEGK